MDPFGWTHPFEPGVVIFLYLIIAAIYFVWMVARACKRAVMKAHYRRKARQYVQPVISEQGFASYTASIDALDKSWKAFNEVQYNAALEWEKLFDPTPLITVEAREVPNARPVPYDPIVSGPPKSWETTTGNELPGGNYVKEYHSWPPPRPPEPKKPSFWSTMFGNTKVSLVPNERDDVLAGIAPGAPQNGVRKLVMELEPGDMCWVPPKALMLANNGSIYLSGDFVCTPSKRGTSVARVWHVGNPNLFKLRVDVGLKMKVGDLAKFKGDSGRLRPVDSLNWRDW